MCTGAEIAIIGATALSAGSAIMGGQQQKDMSEYQADQADADADTARQAAELNAEKVRDKARKVAASARASIASSGLSLDSVTANLINKDIVKRSEEDAIMGVDDADSMAKRLRAGASVDRLRGSSAQKAGYISAGSSALATYGQHKAGWYGGGGEK
jgi:hypothetical protein